MLEPTRTTFSMYKDTSRGTQSHFVFSTKIERQLLSSLHPSFTCPKCSEFSKELQCLTHTDVSKVTGQVVTLADRV